MFSRRTFSSPIIVALTATLLFVGFASLLPGAVAGTTLRDCTANQAMFFEKPALQYPGAQTYLNVHHGGFLVTPTNDVCDGTINFLRCVQGGSFVFSMSSYGTSTANRYSVRMNGVTVVNTAPMSTQQCTQNRNGNNIDGEYSNIDTASYSNVSGLLGTGAPDGGIVSSTMVVTISNSAGTCNPKTITYTLNNPTCQNAVPKCGLAASQGFQLCNTAQCNSQDIFYGDFQQLQGGLLLKNLVTRRTTSTFWLRFGTADSLSYLSLRYNGAWATSTASTPTFSSSKTARAALFGGGSYPIIQLSGWSSDLTNELIFNISGWQAHMECSETIIVRVGNPGCTLTTRITGDPQFAGLRGQSYQVHGIDGGVYNIISNTQMQLNSRFVFLTGPRDCPEMPSTLKKSSACWTHDGSYLGEIALKTRADDRVLIAPGDAETGFKSVEVNGVQVAVGATVALKDKSGVVEGSLERVSTHELVLRVNLFKIRIENVDGFVNLSDLQVMTHEKEEDSRLASAFLVASRLRALRTHGLLGQTWRAHRFHNHLKVIEGEVDDYLIGSGDMFGDDFMFNRFGKTVEEVSGSESTEEQQDAATVEKQ